MDTFQVGEIAIIHGAGRTEWNGCEVEILGPLHYSQILGEWGSWHQISNPPSSMHVERCFALIEHLRKKRPPAYDGNQTTTWDKCEWKPREMVRV